MEYTDGENLLLAISHNLWVFILINFRLKQTYYYKANDDYSYSAA
jgi:hypothetical protein